MGGFLGAILTGLFAQKALGASVDGVFAGNVGVMWVQVLGAAAAMAYSAVVTVGLLWALKLTVGLRVERDDEREGLDVTAHGESAYELD